MWYTALDVKRMGHTKHTTVIHSSLFAINLEKSHTLTLVAS